MIFKNIIFIKYYDFLKILILCKKKVSKVKAVPFLTGLPLWGRPANTFTTKSFN